MGARRSRAVLVLLLVAWGGPPARAQEATGSASSGRTLVVGTKEAPPFAFKRRDGTWSGISVELWRAVAAELGYRYEWRETDLAGLVEGVEARRFDAAVAALTITPEREAELDFTHPFHVSGLAIAVRGRQGTAWLAVLDKLRSLAFLKVILTLTGLLLLVGVLVWLLERRANAEQFGGSAAHGIGAGFWWSAVTMTTVGYGDKAPRTVGGRIVALLWMFTALIVISSFTAAITTTLTVGSLQGAIRGPDDLARSRVGSVHGSTSAQYLDWRQLPFQSFDTPDAALAALAAGTIDAVVYDAPILRYEVRQRFGDGITVLPSVFERQYYGIALPSGSPLREPVNRVLLRRISTPEWQGLLQRYLGSTR